MTPNKYCYWRESMYTFRRDTAISVLTKYCVNYI